MWIPLYRWSISNFCSNLIRTWFALRELNELSQNHGLHQKWNCKLFFVNSLISYGRELFKSGHLILRFTIVSLYSELCVQLLSRFVRYLCYTSCVYILKPVKCILYHETRSCDLFVHVTRKLSTQYTASQLSIAHTKVHGKKHRTMPRSMWNPIHVKPNTTKDQCIWSQLEPKWTSIQVNPRTTFPFRMLSIQCSLPDFCSSSRRTFALEICRFLTEVHWGSLRFSLKSS